MKQPDRHTLCKNLPYKRRLDLLQISDLDVRQNRADMILMFRLTHQIFPGITNDFIQLFSNRRLQKHQFKLKK